MATALVLALLILELFGTAPAAAVGTAGAAVVPPRPVPPVVSLREIRSAIAPEIEQAARDAFYRGDLREAAELLARVTGGGEAVGEGVAAARDLASVYRQLGAVREAARVYGRLAARLPDDPAIAREHAWSVLASGDFAAALPLFERARSLSPDDPWLPFGMGLALERLGRTEEALSRHREAVELDGAFALAWERLGLLHKEAGRADEAAAAFRRALQADPSFTHLTIELAEAYHALGRLRDAWAQYERAARLFPRNEAVQAAVRAFLAEHREIVEGIERERAEGRRRLRHAQVAPAPPPGGIPVRVGLLERAQEVRISAGAPFRLVAEGAGSGAGRGAGGEGPLLPAGLWRLERVGERIRLLAEDPPASGAGAPGELTLPAGEVRLALADPAATWIVLDLDAGRGYFWSFVEDLQVRGDLLVVDRSGGITLVNELDIEAYLLAVVPSEMYASMPLEALKAQAIAARTYTLRHLGRYRERGFDVMGSVLSSAYRGVAREHPRTTEAVLATRGQVLTYEGRLIEAYYHSNAGGHTASSEEVWGGARPYLPGVGEWSEGSGPDFPLAPHALDAWFREAPDVFSRGTGFGLSSTFRWAMMVSAERLAETVGERDTLGRIVAVVPGPRGRGGWLSAVTVVGTKGPRRLSGDGVRSRLGGLKSTAFTVIPLHGPEGVPDHFLFMGAGFGHGVGLSQVGAAGMAQRGASAAAILAHYYPGAALTSNYGRGD